MKIIDELVNSYSKTQKQMIKERTYYKMQLGASRENSRAMSPIWSR